MDKFTVVYASYFQSGSHSHSITYSIHVTCDRKDIRKELEKNDIADSAVWFVFPGHLEYVKW